MIAGEIGMKIYRICWLGLVMTMTAAVVQAMNVDLPKGYIEKPVQDQFKQYRKIYDPVSHIKGENFASVHVPGLLQILDDGFALVNDHIQCRADSEEEKEMETLRLQKLYQAAVKLDENQQMTQLYFTVVNLMIAKIVNYMNWEGGVTQPTGYFDRVIINMFEKLDKSSLEDFSSFQFVKDSFFSIAYDDRETTFAENVNLLWYGWGTSYSTRYIGEDFQTITKERFSPIAIIYSNTGKFFSYDTFVNQTLHNKYGIVAAVLDVTLKTKLTPEEREKTPHYGRWNNTYLTLGHDIRHFLEQCALEGFTYRAFNFDLHEALLDIKNLRDKAYPNKTDKRYKVLTRGLFILKHEYFTAIN